MELSAAKRDTTARPVVGRLAGRDNKAELCGTTVPSRSLGPSGNAAGHDAVIEESISSNLRGTPEMILATLRRREAIDDFEVNGAFSYYSVPYADVEENMRLFAKEVGPEIKSWQPKARRQPQQPIDVRPATAPVVAK